ncbi:hypothetical protein [Longimicrobium sp.]|jgi:hypothetical protein|uniref:hypothetical protein n=1 Tax=Longimicrobium sp. TaxID=2029185 RepID=UPI002F95BE8B
MRKLKLESLQVESFDTAPAAGERGTMYAHEGGPSIETYDIEKCGDTRYFDCTFGCSVNTDCAAGCGETGFDCA